jgi:hypothetical protein
VAVFSASRSSLPLLAGCHLSDNYCHDHGSDTGVAPHRRLRAGALRRRQGHFPRIETTSRSNFVLNSEPTELVWAGFPSAAALARRSGELTVIPSTDFAGPDGAVLFRCQILCRSIEESVRGTGGVAGLECLHDLGDADDDQPDAGGQGEHGDGVEWPCQHHQAADH